MGDLEISTNYTTLRESTHKLQVLYFAYFVYSSHAGGNPNHLRDVNNSLFCFIFNSPYVSCCGFSFLIFPYMSVYSKEVTGPENKSHY